MRPRAVVFDVGNVLYDWRPEYLYAKLIPDAETRVVFLRDVCNAEWHFQHDAGRSFAETSAELIALHPEYRDAITAWGPRFNEQLGAMATDMRAIVEALDARGVPLFAITNFSGEFWPPFAARESDIFGRFRDILVSGDERLVKPDPAVYALALDRFGLGPGEGLFIDDRSENVAGAEAAGLIGHHFHDVGGLRHVLEGYGLLDRRHPGEGRDPSTVDVREIR